MLYEIRKSLIGFQLKLILDLESKVQKLYIFVDLSKTHTIDLLLKEIARRFSLKGDLRLTVHDYEILPDENILVLADIDEVKIHSSNSTPTVGRELKLISSATHLNEGESTYLNSKNSSSSAAERKWEHVPSTLHSNKASTHSVSIPRRSNSHDRDHTNIQVCPTSVDYIISKNKSCEGGFQKESQHSKNENKNSFVHRSLAKFLQQLQEETKNDETSANHAENTNEDDDNDKKYKTKSNYSSPKKSFCQADSDLGDSAVREEDQNETDLSGAFHSEKKKRKRKRKHGQKNREYAMHDLDEIDAAFESESSVQTVTRKHIFFDDADEMEDAKNKKVLERETDSKVLKLANETFPRSVTRSSSPVRNGHDSDEYSKNLTTILNRIKNNEANSVPRDQVRKNVLENVNASTTDTRPSSFLTSEGRQNNSDTETQLGTLLMYRKLQTVGRYEVMFQKQDKSETSSCSESQLNRTVSATNNKSTNASILLPSTSQSIRDKESQLLEREYSPMRAAKNMENIGDKECEEDVIEKPKSTNELLRESREVTSNDCEMLVHFKVVKNDILLRKSATSWTRLTAEVAAKELPSIHQPVEGQAIVFQVLYLKHNVYPTLSDVILGHVLKYNPSDDKVALEIPLTLIEHLLRCSEIEEPELPEGMKFISGAVYELNWIAVKNPKLLS